MTNPPTPTNHTIFYRPKFDEAYDLLQNGILVETNKGLVCMSLTDALASNLNLTADQLQRVASELIRAAPDSDGPSSESAPDAPKRRGGWPKGRKRKPVPLNLPPKAPATGYNLYLNEQRQLFKGTALVFHEITKVIGNQWSNLALAEKQPYLDRADEDKKRYREELKTYRQSYAYRAYLAKKRRNRLQNNVFSESDMDATDEIDDEDNEELYCRLCDQWFHNLHNKREHLQGKQHTQTMAGEISRELKPSTTNQTQIGPKADSLITDCVSNLIQKLSKREMEIKNEKTNFERNKSVNCDLMQQLNGLKAAQRALEERLGLLKEKEADMETKFAQLWQVPNWFVIKEDGSTSE